MCWWRWEKNCLVKEAKKGGVDPSFNVEQSWKHEKKKKILSTKFVMVNGQIKVESLVLDREMKKGTRADRKEFTERLAEEAETAASKHVQCRPDKDAGNEPLCPPTTTLKEQDKSSKWNIYDVKREDVFSVERTTSRNFLTWMSQNRRHQLHQLRGR